jgi:hypothetical protein
MYGPWIGSYISVQKIIKEGDSYVFFIKHHSDTKMVVTNKDLENQIGQYYKGEISDYDSSKDYKKTPSNQYIVRLKPVTENFMNVKNEGFRNIFTYGFI